MNEDPQAALAAARVIAVLGAHDDPSRPAFYVPSYLNDHGYRVLPVNPGRVGVQLFGEPVTATLAELAVPVDIVDVFRPGHALPGHLDDLLAMKPLPRVVWFQSGVANAQVAASLRAAGIAVVEGRCAMVEHRRL